jgi:hypothetical protein
MLAEDYRVERQTLLYSLLPHYPIALVPYCLIALLQQVRAESSFSPPILSPLTIYDAVCHLVASHKLFHIQTLTSNFASEMIHIYDNGKSN